MFYTKEIRNVAEKQEAHRILDKALDYDRDCLKSLGRDEDIEPATESGNAALSVIFTGDSSEFDRVKTMQPKVRASGMALIDDTIYVSLPHFHREWDNDAGLKEKVSWDLKKLGKPTSEEVMEEYVAICLADMIMRFYQTP